MTVDRARSEIIVASLIFTGAFFVFLFIAPSLHYPLSWDQTPRVFEIVLPVFLGYLGTATHFFFHSGTKPKVDLDVNSGVLMLLVRGPLIVFGVAAIAVCIAFGMSNARRAQSGTGMSLDQFAASFTAILGLLAVTTNVAVSYLFSLGERAKEADPKTPASQSTQ